MRFEIDDLRVLSTITCVAWGARFVSDAALEAGEGIDRQELGGFCEDLRRQAIAPPVPIEEEFWFQSDQDMLAEMPGLASAPPAPAPMPGDPAQACSASGFCGRSRPGATASIRSKYNVMPV